MVLSPEYRTLPSLWRLYEATPLRLAFGARTVEEWAAWHEQLSAKLVELLGGFPSPAEHPPLNPVTLETGDTEDYRIEKVAFQSEEDVWTPCYVLTPRQVSPPYRPVIALHGHGMGGAAHLIGRIVDENLAEEEAAHIAQHRYDYAAQLARHGYMVFAPEQRGLGERIETWPGMVTMDDGDPLWQKSCRGIAFNAMLLGKTVIGLRVLDVMRTIDYIAQRPEPVVAGLGCLGLSGGGTTTLFAAALDSRITVAVVSGYLSSFRESIMAIRHCECNYIPGILNYAEMSDIAGLIAPRPLLVESGTQDPIFPVSASRKAYAEVSRIYELLGADDRLKADVFEGAHRFSGRKAFDWLDRWLPAAR